MIPEGLAFLVDDDLLFENENGLRATAVVNEWVRPRPTENCPAPSSWGTYARILRDWPVSALLHGVEIFDTRDRLKGPCSARMRWIAAAEISSSDSQRSPGAST